MPKKGIGIYASNPLSFMDHLVPLCQIMEIPLLCLSPWIHTLAELYYPPMQLLCEEAPDYTLDPFLNDYDVFFYVDHYRKAQGGFQFVEHSCSKKARSVCGLHGNSDKKRNLYWIERFEDEDISLVYGQHMLDFLDEKGVLERLKHCVVTGNYRYEFYLKHQSFFDLLIQPHLFPKNGRKTLLYAPTWTHPNKKWAWSEDYTNLFEVHSFVLDNIPDEYQVLVKLHPFFVHLFPDETERMKEKYFGNEQILFLHDLPLIYPLLAQVDGYLGDYSSIGYDFLSFDKPLFFLNTSERDPEKDKGVYLYNCGIPLTHSDLPQLYTHIKRGIEEDAFSEKRHEINHYAFGKRKELSVLKQEIERAYS